MAILYEGGIVLDVNHKLPLWKQFWVWAIFLVLLGGIGSIGGLKDTTNQANDSCYYTEPQVLDLW